MVKHIFVKCRTRKKFLIRKTKERNGITCRCNIDVRSLSFSLFLTERGSLTRAPSPDPVTNEMYRRDSTGQPAAANQPEGGRDDVLIIFNAAPLRYCVFNNRPDTSTITSANKRYIFITITVC